MQIHFTILAKNGDDVNGTVNTEMYLYKSMAKQQSDVHLISVHQWLVELNNSPSLVHVIVSLSIRKRMSCVKQL